jgi:hypothetical protein
MKPNTRGDTIWLFTETSSLGATPIALTGCVFFFSFLPVLPLSVHCANFLLQIATGARTIFNFADGYHKIVGEHTTPRMIPERLPTEREMTEMLSNVEYMKQSLEQLRDQVQQNLRHEQMQGKMKGPYEDEDVQMYDTAKPTFGVTEVKKRRGVSFPVKSSSDFRANRSQRAAPPGRCHSCNRIDTPEWRRGPDGARTLCNACGLHYAKLERKRLLEARSIRPKGSDEQN